MVLLNPQESITELFYNAESFKVISGTMELNLKPSVEKELKRLYSEARKVNKDAEDFYRKHRL